jgi:hypothetical protein
MPYQYKIEPSRLHTVLALLFQRGAGNFAGMLIRRDYTHSIVIKQVGRKKLFCLRRVKASKPQGRED